MQTFRISKAQEQSYYAIRIFGIVHLIAAVGLVVLIDGPGNGLRGFTWILIQVLLSSSAYLLMRVFQAKAGRIRGHYVMTRNTLAVMLPGQPRKFFLRNECKAFLPHRDELLLRDGRSVSLRSPSSKTYLRDLTSGLCQLWWPAFHGTPLWKSVRDTRPGGSLELRVDFYGRPDGRDPLLVYTGGGWLYARHIAGMAMGCFVLLFFMWLAYLAWVEALENFSPTFSFARYIIVFAAGILGAGVTLTALVYVARQVFGERSLRHAFVISTRGLAALRAGRKSAFYRSGTLRHYNMATGRLFFDDGSNLIVAPYLYGGPYYVLLRNLFKRWRPGHAVLPSNAFGMGLLPNAMALWICGCLLLGTAATALWGSGVSGAAQYDAIEKLALVLVYPFLLFFWWRGLKSELQARTDVSTNAAPDAAILNL